MDRQTDGLQGKTLYGRPMDDTPEGRTEARQVICTTDTTVKCISESAGCPRIDERHFRQGVGRVRATNPPLGLSPGDRGLFAERGIGHNFLSTNKRRNHMNTRQRQAELSKLSARIDRQRFQIQKVYSDMKKSVRPEIHKALSRRNMVAVPDADDVTAERIFNLSADKNHGDNGTKVSAREQADDDQLADNIFNMTK